MDLLRDQQLGRALAHHRFVLKIPEDWALASWKQRGDGYVMACRCTGSKGSPKQIEAGLDETYRWSVRGLLDTIYHEPATLADIGLTQTTVEQINQTILNLWCCNPTSASEANSITSSSRIGSPD
eukprot:1635437-Rhodomonas_salina.1